MKLKFILNAMMVMVAIFTLSFGLSAATGLNPVIISGVLTASSFLMPSMQGVALVGLAKEIWLPELKEKFYPDSSFLSRSKDMSMFVDNDKIHLAEAGVNPDVLKNNTVYPIPMAERPDNPIELVLDYYDTKNTILRNAEKAELSYDKRASVLSGHRGALLLSAVTNAAHNWAPDSNTTNTPVIQATGADRGDGTKGLTFDDIISLQAAYDELDIPEQGRILVLSAKHKADLRKSDGKLYKDLLKEKNMYGFDIYTLATKHMPRYHRGTGVKVAFGAAPDVNDTICSFAYHEAEVMRADGTADMFYKEKDPAERADILGFQKRALYYPIRNYSGAIYSPAV